MLSHSEQEMSGDEDAELGPPDWRGRREFTLSVRLEALRWTVARRPAGEPRAVVRIYLGVGVDMLMPFLVRGSCHCQPART